MTINPKRCRGILLNIQSNWLCFKLIPNSRRQLKADKDDPEFISQRKAYELFGRRNVERWKRQEKVVSYKRPGKVEYRTADLRLLQRTTQDYFDESQPKQAEKPVKKDK